jgi:hypothetical protein
MTTWINVARYQLLQRMNYLALPWIWLAFGFGVDLVIFALVPIGTHAVMTGHGLVEVPNTGGRDAGGMLGIVAVFFALGVLAAARALPFALALGVSRRSYYTGTGLLAVALSAVYGLALSVLQALERVTDGWGESAHIFRVPYLLDGPWYLTWLTSFVALSLLFAYGTWFGIVYRRWSLPGTLGFVATQVVVLLVAALLITWSHAWVTVGRAFTELSAIGLTGLLAVLAAVLLAGGYVTVRRATV